MTLEEKIKHLQNASIAEARAEGNTIIKDHSDALEQVFNDHKETILRQTKLRIKTEENNAKLELNKAIAKCQIELKRTQGICQTQLKQKMFKRVEVLLNEFMDTNAYKDLLCNYILSAIAFANGEVMDIYCTPSDEPLSAELEKLTGAKLTVSREDFIGGIRAVVRGRNILIDRSFKSALAEEYDNFLFTGGNKHA